MTMPVMTTETQDRRSVVMKNILRFRRAEVERAVLHAEKSKRHIKVCGEKKGIPGLVLVHDDGVYLMSSGTPRDLVTDSLGRSRSFVAQAQGTDPKKDSDWHERSSHLVGGDDFAEKLDLSSCRRWLDGTAGLAWMELEFSEEQIAFIFYAPKEQL